MRIPRLFGRGPSASVAPRAPYPMGGGGSGDSPGLDGLGVNSIAMSAEARAPSPLAVAFAIIKLLSTTQGALPRVVHERGDLQRRPTRAPEYEFIWGRPNLDWRKPAISWWTQAFAHFEGWGNTYIWQDRMGSRVTGLELIHPIRVKPYMVKRQMRYILDGDIEHPKTPDEILHIPGLSFDGVKGISPVQAGRAAHEHAMLQERWGSNFLRGGSAPSGVVLTQSKVDETVAKEFQDKWAQRYGGVANVGKVLLLQGGADYKQITIPPEDAQYLQSREFQRTELVGFYASSIPHHLLGWKSNTSNFGTGIEAQGVHLVRYVLMNRLALMSDAISQELLPPDLVLDFNVQELIKADSKVQAEVAWKERQAGIRSREEWREAVSLPPLDFPDDLMRVSNAEYIDSETGEPIGEKEEPPPAPIMMPPQMPPQPPPEEGEGEGEAMIVDELRCQNADCPSRRDGRAGRLLARRVAQATVVCHVCGVESIVEPARVVRDSIDLGDAVLEKMI